MHPMDELMKHIVLYQQYVMSFTFILCIYLHIFNMLLSHQQQGKMFSSIMTDTGLMLTK